MVEMAKIKEQLVEATTEMSTIRGFVADAEAKTYTKNFPNMPEYACLAALFMEVGGDQLIERITYVHPEWDLSFLLVEATPSVEFATPAPSVSTEAALPSLLNEALSCADPNETAGT
ncbi:hypothetical protein Adt_35321 [Abeliophyllum distichum]|uniref:Uncharacterized protein n=1 Tax=Abeliophyllum distichum TaxID=126358 RepID=A0ABD1QED8_9LAMI